MLLECIGRYVFQLQMNARVSAVQKKLVQNASRFPWRNFTDPLTRRQFAKITNLGVAVLPPDDLGKVTIRVDLYVLSIYVSHGH